MAAVGGGGGGGGVVCVCVRYTILSSGGAPSKNLPLSLFHAGIKVNPCQLKGRW